MNLINNKINIMIFYILQKNWKIKNVLILNVHYFDKIVNLFIQKYS